MPAGGAMAGVSEHHFTLGPFAPKAAEVRFRFRCTDPAAPATTPGVGYRTKRCGLLTRIGATRSILKDLSYSLHPAFIAHVVDYGVSPSRTFQPAGCRGWKAVR